MQGSFTSGLVAYWKFSGDGNDSSSNSNNCTVIGAEFTSDRFGNIASALVITNEGRWRAGGAYTADVINITGDNPRTISYWAKFTSEGTGSGGGTGTYTASSVRWGDDSAAGLSYLNTESTGGLWFTWFDGAFVGLDLRSTDPSPIFNEWRMVTLTFAGAVPTAALYVNGVAQTNITVFSPETVLNTVATTGTIDGGQGDYIDDVRIYDRALPASEVKALYKAESPTGDPDNDEVNNYREIKDGTDPNDANSFNPLSKGLVAYYPFNGNANDESGFDRQVQFSDIQVNSTTQLPSYRFSGNTNSYHLTSDIPIPSNNAYTWAFWIQPEILKPRNFLMSRIEGFGADPSTPWIEITAEGQLRFARSLKEDPEQFSLISPQGIVRVGEWGHVTAVSAASGERTLFFNGIKVSEGIDSKYGYELALLLIGADRFLTGHPTHGSGNANFQGNISEVRVYNRALSEIEAAQLFINTSGCADLDSNGLADAADFLAIFGPQQLTAGIASVTINPSAFNLFTAEQYELNRTNGRLDVMADPSTYNLYTSDSIMDLRMGGLMLQKQGSNAVVTFQPQTTTDLATQPFTNNGTAITNEIPMPGNKGFIRIQAMPNSTPMPPPPTPAPTPPPYSPPNDYVSPGLGG